MHIDERGCLCYRREMETLTERHVQAAWYDRSIRPCELMSSDGRRVRVLHPGSWNLGAGPDFKNALLEVDGRRMIGDVEVHISPGDWTRHGHGSDEAYENVVVHVTWNSGPAPATLPKGVVSIWLGRFLTADHGFSPDQIDLSAYPFASLPADSRPCFEWLWRRPDLADKVLLSAGEYRLRTKARRIARLLNAPAGRRPDREQLFYSEVMGALGYSRNSRAFRKVAETVTVSDILAEPENAESALLVASQFVEWYRGATRPRNSPETRLRSAARLFASGVAFELLNETDFSRRRCRAVAKGLSDGGFMGRGRAGAVIANVVVPFALAECRISQVPRWLPPEDVSEPVRLTAFRLFGRDHNPAAEYAGNGLKIQGLIQIHRDYCLQVHPDCGDCSLVECFWEADRAMAGGNMV